MIDSILSKVGLARASQTVPVGEVKQIMATGLLRGYSAAQKVARYGDFKGSDGSANYELRGALREVRNKCRSLERNSPAMRRFIQLLQVNVVGDAGFAFQSGVKRLDGERDDSLNERVERDWKYWSAKVTTCGQMDFVELCEQAIRCLGVDGEFIWEKSYNPLYRDGFAINPIEADLLDETLTMTAPATGNRIVMGVEIDSHHRPVAYWFLNHHPGDTHTDLFLPRGRRTRHRRVPADRVIHGFIKRRPGQTRGEPHACSVINTIKMLDGYREAETTGRRLRSSIMGFITSTQPTVNGLEELADRVVEDVNAESQKELSLEMSVSPGMVKELPTGKDFKSFDPGSSQTDFGDFEKQGKKNLAAGFGMSVVSHGMETEAVSYSTHRGIITEDRDYYKTIHRFMIHRAIFEVFDTWLPMRVLQPDCNIPPSRMEIIIRSKQFRGRGWDWINPKDEETANSMALGNYTTSYSRIARKLGYSRDDLFAEIADDIKVAAKYGLKLSYGNVITSQKNQSGKDEDGKEGTNDDE